MSKGVKNGVSATTPLNLIKNNSDLLNYAINNGIIDLPNIQEAMVMAERKRFLDMHPYEIWENKDGKFCVNIPDDSKKEGRVVRRRNTRKEIEDVIIEYWKSQEECPTLDDLFNEWNDRRLNLKKISPSTHTRNARAYKRFYSEFGKRKIKYLQPTEVEDFLEEQISKHNLKAKAFAGLKGITKGFLLRAKKRGFITWNVLELMNELDVTDQEFAENIIEDDKEIFYDDEMDAIINYCKQDQDIKNLGIVLMFVTGIRIGELVTIKHSDFDGLVLSISRSETCYYTGDKRVVEVQDKTKTAAGRRKVVIPEKYQWLVNKLRLYNPFGEYIFVRKNGDRMNTGIIRKRLYKICNDLGIQRRSPHKIRKTYGSILLDNKVDNKLIEKQMGHLDVSTTELHYHRDRKRLQQKMDILNAIPEFAVTH